MYFHSFSPFREKSKPFIKVLKTTLMVKKEQKKWGELSLD